MGEISTLIGYNSKYIPPSKPDLTLETDKFPLSDCVQR